MTFENYKQCESVTKYPVNKLKLAKKLGADGFRNSSKIYWEEFQQWLAVPENSKLLDDACLAVERKIAVNKSLDEVELENKIKDGVLKDLDIRKKQGEYLSPDEVKQFLLKLRLSFESVVKGWTSSLPPRLVGKPTGEIEHVLNGEVASMFSNFRTLIKDKFNS